MGSPADVCAASRLRRSGQKSLSHEPNLTRREPTNSSMMMFFVKHQQKMEGARSMAFLNLSACHSLPELRRRYEPSWTRLHLQYSEASADLRIMHFLCFPYAYILIGSDFLWIFSLLPLFLLVYHFSFVQLNTFHRCFEISNSCLTLLLVREMHNIHPALRYIHGTAAGPAAAEAPALVASLAEPVASSCDLC